jgi:hypothetical protein
VTLIEKQKRFAFLITKLITFGIGKGYEFTFGEAHRPRETAELYAKDGRGIVDSLHCIRLAIDLNAFKDGVYLTKSEDYRELGEFWESLSVPGCECHWGGRWGDGNHLSVGHAGKK